MLHLEAARGLHHVEGADHVAVEIGARVFKAVAHPGLGREMHDHIGREVVRDRVQQLLILQHAFGHRKIRILQQHRVAALFQRDVIVIRHAVIAVHHEAFGQQEFREVKSDEPGGSGDKDTFQNPSLSDRRKGAWFNPLRAV